jgi:acyl-CoA synthetase (NDP forming)
VVLRNLLDNGYPGAIYPVNPEAEEILGIRVYPTIASLPDGVEVGVVLLPAQMTVPALQECVAKGMGHIVLSAGGFAEFDDRGGSIQRELSAIIKQTGVRVLGPNTSGHTSTPAQLTTSFFPLGKIRPGQLSYIAQTGNFATHTMKLILTSEHYGVARVIGLGNKIDVEESEALEYLGDDPQTHAILMYLESIDRPREFLHIASRVTRHKPVIMLKTGATDAGRQAAVAHTAALGTEDRLVDGLLRQAGVVRIHAYTHLVLLGRALSSAPLPRGNRVAVLAPSGAMLVSLADLCARLGLRLPDLEAQTLQRLEEHSGGFIRLRNPVDIWALTSKSGIKRAYEEGIDAVMDDPHVDAVAAVLMLSPDQENPSPEVLKQIVRAQPEKPLLLSFTGDRQSIEAFEAEAASLQLATFGEIEQPLEVLSVVARCRGAMDRPE